MEVVGRVDPDHAGLPEAVDVGLLVGDARRRLAGREKQQDRASDPADGVGHGRATQASILQLRHHLARQLPNELTVAGPSKAEEKGTLADLVWRASRSVIRDQRSAARSEAKGPSEP